MAPCTSRARRHGSDTPAPPVLSQPALGAAHGPDDYARTVARGSWEARQAITRAIHTQVADPATTILGYLELVLSPRCQLPGEVRAQLERAASEAERLHHAIDGIMNLCGGGRSATRPVAPSQ